MSKPAPRIEYDDDGELDDLWQPSADIHIERMDTNWWWVGIYLLDGTRVTLHVDNVRVIEAPHNSESGV